LNGWVRPVVGLFDSTGSPLVIKSWESDTVPEALLSIAIPAYIQV